MPDDHYEPYRALFLTREHGMVFIASKSIF
jgi:hypothetical protein